MSHSVVGRRVKASSLGQTLAAVTAARLDRQGRLVVEPDLSLPDHPEILVLGDLTHSHHGVAEPLPGVAPVAMQQGRYAARINKYTACRDTKLGHFTIKIEVAWR